MATTVIKLTAGTSKPTEHAVVLTVSENTIDNHDGTGKTIVTWDASYQLPEGSVVYTDTEKSIKFNVSGTTYIKPWIGRHEETFSIATGELRIPRNNVNGLPYVLPISIIGADLYIGTPGELQWVNGPVLGYVEIPGIQVSNGFKDLPKIDLEQIYDETNEDRKPGERVTSTVWNEVIQTLRTHINLLIPHLRDVIKWQGVWSLSTTYTAGSVVYHDHKVFVAKEYIDAADIINITNTKYWEPIAIQGTGIADIKLNEDYTLTFELTDGGSITTGSVRGEQGNAAKISGATASVTNTSGIPTVKVTTQGPDMNRSFDFAFTNLKGDKGDNGVYVGSGEVPPGTNVQVDPEGAGVIEIPDIEYIDAELAKKADITYVDNQGTTLQEHIDLKADKTYVDTALGKKADKTYVNTELNKKADTTYVDTELGKKTSKTYVDTALEKKTDKTYVDTALDKKADITYVNDNFANAPKATVSGKRVEMTDISPITHTLDCKLTSDISIDYQNVTVSTCGKNLIKPSDVTHPDVTRIFFRGKFIAKKGVKYSLSSKTGIITAISGNNRSTGQDLFNRENLPYSFMVEKDANIDFFLTDSANDLPIENIVNDLMFNIGEPAPYEAYQGADYTPNADGTIDNVSSIYPYMQMFTDNENVILNATYNLDTNRSASEYVNDTFSNALKGKEFGSVISVDDVSPIEHNVKCKAESKNLLNLEAQEEITPGITFSILEDNTIHIYGENTSTRYQHIELSSPIIPKDAENLVISTNKLWSTDNLFLVVGGSNSNYQYGEPHFNKSKSTIVRKIKTDGDNTLGYFILRVSKNSGVIDETFKLQIEKETKDAPTPYTPYVDVSNTNVNVCGKNLMDNKLLVEGSYSGITHTSADEQQEVKVSGTATRTIYFNLFNRNVDGGIPIPKFWKGKTLGLEVFGEHKIGYSIGFYDYTVSKWTWLKENKKTIVPLTAKDMYFRGYFTNGETYDETVKFMLCIDENAKEFSKFVCADYIPNADGTVNGIKSIAPNMTILSDTDGVNIDCEYNKDINKVFEKLQQAIISTGGNV